MPPIIHKGTVQREGQTQVYLATKGDLFGVHRKLKYDTAFIADP